MIDSGWQDLVNGLFEFLAGGAAFLHVRALWRSKRVQGVSVWAIGDLQIAEF